MTPAENLTLVQRVGTTVAGAWAMVLTTDRAHSEGPGATNSEALDAGPASP